jgi:hypothetical protein
MPCGGTYYKRGDQRDIRVTRFFEDWSPSTEEEKPRPIVIPEVNAKGLPK